MIEFRKFTEKPAELDERRSTRSSKIQYKSRMDQLTTKLDRERNRDGKIEIIGQMISILFEIGLYGVKR